MNPLREYRLQGSRIATIIASSSMERTVDLASLGPGGKDRRRSHGAADAARRSDELRQHPAAQFAVGGAGKVAVSPTVEANSEASAEWRQTATGLLHDASFAECRSDT